VIESAADSNSAIIGVAHNDRFGFEYCLWEEHFMTAMPVKGNTTSTSPAPKSAFVPPPITRVEDTGLSFLWLQDLVLKDMYFQGYMSGFKIAEDVALPFTGVVDQILEALKREKLLEIRSSQSMGLGEGAYTYAITGAGIDRAREALERSQYAGPAPVPLNDYYQACLKQTRGHLQVTNRIMRQVLSNWSCMRTPSRCLGPRLTPTPRSFCTARPEMVRPPYPAPLAT
jgi:hypothetical protein